MKPNLDLLRAVAVLCVLISHLLTVVTGKQTLLLHKYGQLGVVLFFVHTSLVLMQSLDRQHLTGPAMFKQFYIQRVCRIYPLSIFFILCIFFLGHEQWTSLELLSNLTLTHNLTYSRPMNGVLWSLPVEVQMYIALPFLYVLFRNRPWYWLIALWVASIPLAIVVLQISHRLNVMSYVPCFLGGVIAWRMQGRETLPGWAWPPLLAAACAGFVLFADPWNNDYGRWVICLLLGLAIPHLHQLTTPRLNAVSKIVAQYSYGIYLFHYPLLDFAFKTLGHYHLAVQWGVFVGSLAAVTYLAYHLIEHPMIKVGRVWSERTGMAKTPAPAA